MNRKAIRDLAAVDLKLKTAKYKYANSLEELREGVKFTGIPCVVKPLMSSSGKGQSVIKTESDIEKAWNIAMKGSRGDLMEVIVEAFIDFDYEITLLTLTQNNGNTLFCPPIGHRQERGDYQESWQPAIMNNKVLLESQKMASTITSALGGFGIYQRPMALVREMINQKIKNLTANDDYVVSFDFRRRRSSNEDKNRLVFKFSGVKYILDINSYDKDFIEDPTLYSKVYSFNSRAPPRES